MSKIKSIAILLVTILLLGACISFIVSCTTIDDSGKATIKAPIINTDSSEEEQEHQHTVVVDSAISATSTSHGLTEGSHCSSCGAVIVAQEETPMLCYTVTLNVFTTENETEESEDLSIIMINNLGVSQTVSISNGGTYSNIVSIQLAAHSPSTYLNYTMGGVADTLYNQGSGNPSAVLQLTGNVSIDCTVFVQECILTDTLITMADGTYKRLGDIVVGDVVLSYDWETMTLIENPVIYASSQDNETNWQTVRYFKRTFSDGTVIKNAFAHRFYNFEQKKFVHLDFWNIGDHVYKQDGTFAALVSCEVVYEPCEFGRITLQYGTNYFANGCLTGDSGCPQNIEF